MLFGSPVFLFLFLPLVLLAAHALPRRLQNYPLLLASLVFYAFGEPLHVALLIVSAVANFGFGRWIEGSAGARRKRAVLALAVAFDLAPLFALKYWEFFAASILEPFGIEVPRAQSSGAAALLGLPAGLSFYTFQAISYVVDVYRGTVPAQRSLVRFALYLSFFPQLIAGPIVRYVDIAAGIDARRTTLESFASGIRRFAIGLAKKVIIADGLAAAADGAFGAPAGDLTAGGAWFGLTAFALQVYCDFSGYSDMAIGLGRMFGFELLENFRYPFVAKSCADFWRRWHISLSSWVRDYIYVSLGGNRLGLARENVNIAAAFLLSGLWHGARWTFVLWGAYHACFLLAERTIATRIAYRPPRVVASLATLAIFLVSMVLFRATDVAHALAYARALAGAGGSAYPAHLWLDPWTAFVFFAGVAAALPIAPWLEQRLARFGESGVVAGALCANAAAAGSFAACLLEVAAGTFQPFLYFRF